MAPPHNPHRRLFLGRGAAVAHAAAAAVLLPKAALASLSEEQDLARRLAFNHLHTHEQLALVYAQGEQFVPAALPTLNHFLRDHYSGDVGVMDPDLFHLLHRVRVQKSPGHPDQQVRQRQPQQEFGHRTDADPAAEQAAHQINAPSRRICLRT